MCSIGSCWRRRVVQLDTCVGILHITNIALSAANRLVCAYIQAYTLDVFRIVYLLYVYKCGFRIV